MSRIGRLPVAIPPQVEIRVEGQRVHVKGPKGEVARTFHPDVQIAVEDGRAIVRRPTDARRHRALHGLSRALLANMVRGVTDGFSVELEIIGTGYRAAKQGDGIVFQVGYSHPVTFTPPAGVTVDVPQPNRIVVRGVDREAVGQVAAKVRAIRPPDPYKGKGIRYAGERVKLKPGKAGRAVGKK
ncbi:MAG: 50S ribosomal protein L6 [Armatimonadota bacterium]|nr:50S ribosomal protein L6 [Armatimonadota bacterium]MDR5697111.1 50S ribosomal protein L6 [Armatimonadota bacterium]